jgi:hypothetical protein
MPGTLEQSVFVAHCTQVWVVRVSQTGVAPEHCELLTQPTQVLLAVLQCGVAPLHPLSFTHCTQEFVAVLHCMPVPQSALTTQPTQVLVAVLHLLVAPEHVVLSTHCTQVLFVVLQACVLGRAAQSVLVTHCTQVLFVVLHCGVVPVHAVLFVEVHCTQASAALHAGLPATPVQLVSARHCTQLPPVTLHSGVAPEQERLLPHMHLPPEHWLAVVVLHWTLQLPQKLKLLFKSSHTGAMDTRQHEGVTAPLPSSVQLSSTSPLQLLSLPSQISGAGVTASVLQVKNRRCGSKAGITGGESGGAPT